MIFQGIVDVTAALVGPNPITNPGDVPDALVTGVPRRVEYADTPPSRTWATLDAPSAETVTVSIYALDERSLPPDHAPSGAELADRRFYLVQSGVVLTAGTLTALTGPVPSGPIYVRPTADTLTGSGRVMLAVQ